MMGRQASRAEKVGGAVPRAGDGMASKIGHAEMERREESIWMARGRRQAATSAANGGRVIHQQEEVREEGQGQRQKEAPLHWRRQEEGQQRRDPRQGHHRPQAGAVAEAASPQR